MNGQKGPSQYEKVKAITDRLEAGIHAVFESVNYKNYLKTLSKFHEYSLNNTLLIAMQKPDATLVAGYTAWQKQFGRQVQKGETGIRILAPTPYKKKMEVEKTDPHTGEILMNPDGSMQKETQEVLMPAFKVVNVFDVSQTEGRPLPELGVNELTGDVSEYEMFFEALKRSCPVPIGFEQIEGGAKGYFHMIENRIAIQEGMSEAQTVKTLVHEMTHQRLHSLDPDAGKDALQPKLTRNAKEVEAESVAFTVCQHFGIDTGDYSFAYVAGWSRGKETPELKASLDKIRKTASEMITTIETNLTQLKREYTWNHLTAADVKNIECTGSEYFAVTCSSEHTFTCEIAGDPVKLTYETSHHDDGEGFVIHSEGKDIWDLMPEPELFALEVTLSSAVTLHGFLQQVEKAETLIDMKEIDWGIMEDENLFLLPEHREKLHQAMNAKEEVLAALPEKEKDSVLTSLHEKAEPAETDRKKTPVKGNSRRKEKMR